MTKAKKQSYASLSTVAKCRLQAERYRQAHKSPSKPAVLVLSKTKPRKATTRVDSQLAAAQWAEIKESNARAAAAAFVAPPVVAVETAEDRATRLETAAMAAALMGRIRAEIAASAETARKQAVAENAMAIYTRQ